MPPAYKFFHRTVLRDVMEMLEALLMPRPRAQQMICHKMRSRMTNRCDIYEYRRINRSHRLPTSSHDKTFERRARQII